MIDKEAKRVIHVVSDMHRGGAETMIMNLYRNIDRSKLQFDFICHYRKDDINGIKKRADYYDEIESLGGRIFKVPSLGTSNPIEYILNIKNILIKNGPFEAIHVHTNKQSGFALLGARLANLQKRIVHSHITEWNYGNKISTSILKNLMKINSTKYCACGVEAGINAFGQENFEKNYIYVLNNAIEVNKFNDISIDDVDNLRRTLNIPKENIIIGNIGRLDEQKNHDFIIDLAYKMKEDGKKFTILLIGNGHRKKYIEDRIKDLDLSESVKILGVRKDINILMNLFDVFILPSLYEGLPLVSVEAQAAGTRCIVSDTVTNEIDMGLGLVKQLSIDNESLDVWESAIFEENELKLSKKEILEKITQQGYNVSKNVNKLYELYEI